MTVYHGSDVVVEHPVIIEQNRFLNFGFGFYTKTNREQAVAFAHKVSQRRKINTAIVNVYNVDEKLAFSECSALRFDGADDKWLDSVTQNRSLRDTYVCDCVASLLISLLISKLVSIRVADAGVLSKQQTLEALKVRKLYNQLVFTTDRALCYLEFIKKELV